MQQNGPKNIGFFGTRNMGFSHQKLIEVLSYAMVLTVRTSAVSRRQPAPSSCCMSFTYWPPAHRTCGGASFRP